MQWDNGKKGIKDNQDLLCSCFVFFYFQSFNSSIINKWCYISFRSRIIMIQQFYT